MTALIRTVNGVLLDHPLTSLSPRLSHAPLLFLDIDGVIAPLHYTDPGRVPPESLWCVQRADAGALRDWRSVDPDAVDRVNYVCRRTSAFIIVSSTWRQRYPIEELEELLADRGLVRGLIRGYTPDLASQEHGPLWRPARRGDEIAAWRSEHGHTGPFAVVDDTSDMDAVVFHFVPTDLGTGLLDKHVDALIGLLLRRPLAELHSSTLNHHVAPEPSDD